MLALSGNAFAKKKKIVATSNHWSFQPVAAEHRYGEVDAFLNEAMANKKLRATRSSRAKDAHSPGLSRDVRTSTIPGGSSAIS